MGRIWLVLGGAALLLLGAGHADAAPLIPTVSLGVGTSENPQDVATSMQLLAVLTIVSLAPAILVMTTSFVRIVVVIGFLHTVPGRLLVVVIIVHLGASGGGRCGGPGRGSRFGGGRLAMAVVDGDRRVGLHRLRRVPLRRGVR